VDARDQLIAEQAQRIDALEAELAARDDKDRRIAELEATIVARDARISELEQKVSELGKLAATLMEKLGRNSSNSHLPPSSDGPGGRSKDGAKSRPRKSGKRKRGAQRGHRGSQRTLLPEEQVDHFVNLYPEHCENCWKELPQVPDPDATRYQVTEVPPVVPETTEFRRHAVTCACCGFTTQAKVEGVVPISPFGPRLMSLIALFTGVYHLSRRKTAEVLHDVLGVQISVGAISNVENRVSQAVEPAVQEVQEHVERASVKHADATSWLQGGKLLSLWTIATKMATLFSIVVDGSAARVKPLFGACRGILVSDRATVFSFWAMNRRQVCWAHLVRKFIAFSERDGPAGRFGRELLDYSALIFEYWHSYRERKIDKATFRAWMAPVRTLVENSLKRAVAADIENLSGSCADMLAHQAALWTFVERDGVEPTNNHAERELRAFVLWRKRSFGTQSDRGNRFAERLMTVAHTARKQGKNVLTFLTACCQAQIDDAARPSLLGAEPTT